MIHIYRHGETPGFWAEIERLENKEELYKLRDKLKVANKLGIFNDLIKDLNNS